MMIMMAMKRFALPFKGEATVKDAKVMMKMTMIMIMITSHADDDYDDNDDDCI